MDIIGLFKRFPAFARSVLGDVRTELGKWLKGRTTLDSLPGRPCITHIQGMVVFSVFIIVMVGMFSVQASSIKVGARPGGGGGGPVNYTGAGWALESAGTSDSGTVSANSDAGTQALQVTERNLNQVQFVLRWTDEPDRDFRHTNQPDELGVRASSPNGENLSLSAKNPQGGEGVVTLTFNFTQTKVDGTVGTGDWSYTVFAKACGAQTPPRIGLAFTDTDNSYSLEITWKYYVQPTK